MQEKQSAVQHMAKDVKEAKVDHSAARAHNGKLNKLPHTLVLQAQRYARGRIRVSDHNSRKETLS